MLQAFLIMLVALAITAVTGFIIALLIHVLTILVQLKKPAATTADEDELAALALAIALRKRA